MKSFWVACLLVLGFVAMAVSCGPKHAYCPDEKDMECHVYDEAGTGGTGGMDLGPCDGGAREALPDGGYRCL